MSAGTPALLAALQGAIRDHALHMMYQPKLSLSDGSVTRVEALVRWEDAKFGTVEPSLFVPVAEAHGLIDDLTMWGLRTVLRQWVDWSEKGIDCAIALNISALSLQNLDFPDLVERMCRALQVPSHRLVLELTEGATQPLIKLMDTLTRFRIKGIGLAIDDFGTGYSSLMQLRQLPFTEVKIDRAFVADAPESSDSRLIVKAIIELAHGLGLTATAEGVETPEQLHLVRELGGDLVQGYLIAAPMTPAEFPAWRESFAPRWAEINGADRPATAQRRTGRPERAAGLSRN
jgi:EAL domain-containing protein (putative c-di-GMP-specific phosphodiesterase class I)